jgi:hypothetical protein
MSTPLQPNKTYWLPVTLEKVSSESVLVSIPGLTPGHTVYANAPLSALIDPSSWEEITPAESAALQEVIQTTQQGPPSEQL